MSKKNKPDKKKNLFWLWIVILIIVGGMFYYFFSQNSLKSISIESAYLQLKSGRATILRGENSIEVINNKSIKIGDVIECNGQCKLIIDNNKIVLLKKGARIKFEKKDVKGLYLKDGEIWTKVARLTGKKDFYVRNDNFVAMVEGTLFKFTTEKVVLIEGKLRVKNEKEKKELVLEQNKSFDFKARIIKNVSKEDFEEAKKIEIEVTDDLKNQVITELCSAYKDYEKIINKFSKEKIDCNILYQNKDVIIETLKQINSTEDIIRIAKQSVPENILNNRIVQLALKSVLKNKHISTAIKLSKKIK